MATVLFFFPCCLIYHLYTFPPSGSAVEGVFYIQSVKKSDRFTTGWSYTGVLKTEGKRICCRYFCKDYFSPSALYKIKGSVRVLKGKFYHLKCKEPWEFVKPHASAVIWRSKAQDYVKHYIEKHFPERSVSSFLIGMVTGQLEDRVMLNEFGQLGLSHLMAISGLHFSLIALVFHLFFRLFLPPKIEASCLMVLLTLYLLFIGETPSILRAWIAVMVFLLGQLLEKRGSALNSLGIALCLTLIWNPLFAMTLSFQLSFLATAGILFFYSTIDQLLNSWLPKKPLKDMVSRHWALQHGYILTSLFREALALTVAVHLTLFPLLLATFHMFSINSLLYNLFFPFLASVALLFFLISIPLGSFGHLLNGYYCEWILHLTHSPPVLFKSFYIEQMPNWLLTLSLTALLMAAIICKIGQPFRKELRANNS